MTDPDRATLAVLVVAVDRLTSVVRGLLIASTGMFVMLVGMMITLWLR